MKTQGKGAGKPGVPNDQRAADRVFWESVWTLHAALAPHTGEIFVSPGPTAAALNAAAAAAMAYARKSGDRLAWSVVLATFEDFVKYGKTPPRALLTGLADVFATYRGAVSMDEAFGVRGTRGGDHRGLAGREEDSTTASLFRHYRKQGLSVEEAKARTAEFCRVSESTVWSRHMKVATLVKSDHSKR